MQSQVEIMHGAGFLTAAEAASLIGAKHVGTIHRMVKREELVGERVGTHWYVSASSLVSSVAASGVMTERVRAYCRDHSVKLEEVKKGGTRGKGKRAAAR